MRKVSKIVCRGFQRVIKEGQRLKIIKLENYNPAKELLIEREIQGCWALYDIRAQGLTVRELLWLSTGRQRGLR